MRTKRKNTGLSLLSMLERIKCLRRERFPGVIIIWGLCLGFIAVSLQPQLVSALDNTSQASNPNLSSSALELAVASLVAETQSSVAAHPKRVNFEGERKSRDAQNVADWVLDSGDNNGMPFVIVDKTDAKVFVFRPDGQLRGAAPCLLGLARGDDSIPGIGNRDMKSIRPEERTTPAGRFIASLGRNFYGKEILWVDYDGAVSLHRVVTNKPAERRLERLSSPTPLDNRISYGCINVPVKFFDNVVKPSFAGTKGIVYVLPEIRSKKEVFASYYDVD